jgi:hypothetical protein
VPIQVTDVNQGSKAAAIDAALRRIGGLSKDLLGMLELEELPNILGEDELPEMLVSGMYMPNLRTGYLKGILLATDRRFIIVDKGKNGTLKVEEFPYSKTTAVETRTGGFAGEIVVDVSGEKKKIERVPKSQVRVFADFLQTKEFPLKYEGDEHLPPVGNYAPEFVDTKFDVILQRPGLSTINVIKEVKEITSLGLRKVKTLVESAPAFISEGVNREEADAIQSRLERVGASTKIVPHSGTHDPYQASQSTALESALENLDSVSKGLLVKREIKELPNILREEELPEKLAAGRYNNGYGILVATGSRVIFIDKGMLGALKIEDFSYDRISSIESSTGMLMGEITIYVSGNKAKLESIPNDQLSLFADFVRSRISKANDKNQGSLSPAPVFTVPAPTPVSIADELEKFAKLRDQGIISDDEFNAQKTRLLQ